MYGVIYKITNIANNKVYIGQTIQDGGFDSRYLGDIQKNTHNKHLKNSIDKYGIENFEIAKEFDTASSQEELNNKEMYWINYYNSTNPKYGYNKREGGANGILNEESKSKISKTKHFNRELIENNLIKKIEKDGIGKFYGFDNVDKNMCMNIPLELIMDCDNEIDILSISAICYLYINTNKLGYSIFNLKDMINKCGFNNTKSRIISKFKKVLLNLQYYDYIDSEIQINSINLNSFLKTKLNLNINNEEYIAVNIFDINKLMELNILEDTSKVLRLYLYLIYLSNSSSNIINGLINITEALGLHKETISKYLNVLTENNLIYYCDLGYIKTSLGTIRGGTCYAISEKNLEIIKKNAEYIEL